jgi:hypothetical protein
MNQRTELEKALQVSKADVLEVEKRADDYYRQLVSTKENLDILHNE